MCGVCHSYSAHLYERLGAELGTLDGMTMKQEFCDDLVSACSDEIPAIARTYPGGLSYCEKHVGPTGDQFWSYPYEERESSRVESSAIKSVFIGTRVVHGQIGVCDIPGIM